MSGTTRVSRYQKGTGSSVIAEKPMVDIYLDELYGENMKSLALAVAEILHVV